MIAAQDIQFLQNKFAYLRDEEAYRKLFFHYYPLLKKFCITILKDAEDSEEVVSDVLLKIWAMGSELNYIENLTLYLFKATRNGAYDVLRKRNRLGINEEITEESREIADSQHPEAHYVGAELNKHIQQAIAGLPLQCQLVFRLIREQGFSYKQTAEILGVSLNTIETQMRIALKKLRVALKAYLS